MKCEDVESAMIDYLDNILEDTRRREIEKHLETCERCLDELKDFQHILDSVESSELEQPDESLRINFYHMLHGEVNKQLVAGSKTVTLKPSGNNPAMLLKLAAGIALLLAGTFLGTYLNSSPRKGSEKTELAELKTEVQQMKEMVMMAMIDEESPSRRIQAVNYAGEIQAPDDKVLHALTATLNSDRNVNVRLAAAYSLARYADRASVRDSLVESLYNQSEPIIQVVLINILVEMKESNAIKPIQQIISNENTLQDVKNVAEQGIKILM